MRACMERVSGAPLSVVLAQLEQLQQVVPETLLLRRMLVRVFPPVVLVDMRT